MDDAPRPKGMQRRFGDTFGLGWLPAWRRERAAFGWVPTIDVMEKDDKYIVKADLPGMKEEDVDVSVVGDALVIKGERKEESEVKEEDYYCCERSYGSFSRSVALPSNVDADKIEADYSDGVLEVTLPKAAGVQPKKIGVSAKKKKKES